MTLEIEWRLKTGRTVRSRTEMKPFTTIEEVEKLVEEMGKLTDAKVNSWELNCDEKVEVPLERF